MGITASLDGTSLYIGGFGALYRYDIPTNTISATAISGGNPYSAVVTGLDGKIYVTDQSNNRILKYDPATNTYSIFKTGALGVNGLAVDPNSGDIFAAYENTGEIWRFSENGSSNSLFAGGLPIDGGFYPTALKFSANGDGLYYLDSGPSLSAFDLREIKGFQVTTVPEPTSLALIGLGFAGLLGSRYRKAKQP